MSALGAPAAGIMGAVMDHPLCAMCGQDARPGHELCGPCLAAFRPMMARGRQGGERWWVLAEVDGPIALHLPALGEVDALAWGEGAALLADVVTGCGDAVAVARANAYTSRLIERCARCGAAAGYPPGLGAPHHDAACAPRLRERLAAAW